MSFMRWHLAPVLALFVASGAQAGELDQRRTQINETEPSDGPALGGIAGTVGFLPYSLQRRPAKPPPARIGQSPGVPEQLHLINPLRPRETEASSVGVRTAPWAYVGMQSLPTYRASGARSESGVEVDRDESALKATRMKFELRHR